MVYGYPSLLHLYLSPFIDPFFPIATYSSFPIKRVNARCRKMLHPLDMLFFKLSLCLLEKKPYLSVVLSSLPKPLGIDFGAKASKICYLTICCSSFDASFGEDGASFKQAASHCRKAKSTLVD